MCSPPERKGDGMSGQLTNELMQAVLLATDDQRKQAALRLLRGETPVPVSQAGPLLLGATAAAAYLGVGRSTLWRIIRSGRLTRIEIMPGTYRIRRADLDSFVAGGKGGQP